MTDLTGTFLLDLGRERDANYVAKKRTQLVAWPEPPVSQYRKACAELDRLEQWVEELGRWGTELHHARAAHDIDAEPGLLQSMRDQAEEQWLLLAYALPKPCDRCSGKGGRVDSLMFGNGGWSGLTTAENPTVWVPCERCDGSGQA